MSIEAKQVYEWVKTGHWSKRQFMEWFTSTEESSNAAKAAATQRNDSEHLEPVAWTDGDDLVLRQDWAELFDWQGSWVGVGRAIPNKWKPTLYTQPQPKAEQEPKREWVGLTDEEIMDVAFNFDVPSISLRTIEAKLKEKNT
jgi:hypothetical protein